MKTFFNKVKIKNKNTLLRILIKYEIINKLKSFENKDDIEKVFNEKLKLKVYKNVYIGNYKRNPYFYKELKNSFALFYSLNDKRYKINFYKK